MRTGILTSSRADYGIYLPLLKELQEDPMFDLGLLVFGTHLSKKHGYTIDQIRKDGFRIDHEVFHIENEDTEKAISVSMAKVMEAFAAIWEKESKHYDIVFCLGDRYEMFAAVAAAAPFRINFAHVHGGETSLGAIDNEFRHCITIFSKLHFAATTAYAEKIALLKGALDNIHVVGSLSLDNLTSIPLLNRQEMQERFGIDIDLPTILVTFHPETVNLPAIAQQGIALVDALKEFSAFQVVITMPNADPMGNRLREIYQDAAGKFENFKLVENFGTQAYFTAMKNAAVVAGNSSSGIIEAASFGKYVVNIGDRQKGRAVSDNVINCESEKTAITTAISNALANGAYTGENIYYKKDVARAIKERLIKWTEQNNISNT